VADRTRFFFDDVKDAADALVLVLEHARNHKDVQFRFGPTTAPAILQSGLWLEGQIADLADSIGKKILAVRHDE
jgi:hypothetical protein